MYANMTSLNNWRQLRGFSTYDYDSLPFISLSLTTLQIHLFFDLMLVRPVIRTILRRLF